MEQAADILDIKTGQIFSVEGKKYIVVLPQTDQQQKETNGHGHLVCCLTDI